MPRDNEFKYEIPAKYKHELKVMPCRECGKPMQVGIRTQKPPRCQECGLDAMIKHNTDLHYHRGAAYDAWRNAMRRYIEDTPPPTPPPEETAPPDSKE